GAAVFAGGAVLYAMNKLGGGDVKLLAAISVWAGFEHLPDLLLYVALGGGALAIGLIVVRRAIMSLRVAGAGGDTTSLPRVLLEGEAVPYGLAIAPSAILIGRDLPHLGAFLFP
ncbi:MAG TPA: prepilin peptidase, partial [Hyphomicrobiales bacterium]|nr:prepilin peptidase [Hyphomicrobiales bacterium]